MTIERTLSIIKPDGVAKRLIGEIIHRLERVGLRVIAAKMQRLTLERAQEFYAVHQDRPFFDELTKYMSSGPIFVQVLEGEDAVIANREVMGATDPNDALAGTIRADFAESIHHNVVHGSDGLETASQEIQFFFSPEEIVTYVPIRELA